MTTTNNDLLRRAGLALVAAGGHPELVRAIEEELGEVLADPRARKLQLALQLADLAVGRPGRRGPRGRSTKVRDHDGGAP